jgi:3-oxoacyl-[acyl-carrier protein] reductase
MGSLASLGISGAGFRFTHARRSPQLATGNQKLETVLVSIPLSLDNKVALITGGSRGIGRAAVRMFVAAGAQVMFNYEKSKDRAEKLVQELGKDRCAATPCNLSGAETAADLIAATIKRFGRLDMLVANHGVWPSDDIPVDQMSEAQWRRTLSINLDAVFGLIKHSVAQMKKQGKSGGTAGHMVLVSSTAGQRGEAFHCDYAASKGALISMVKGLSTELARDGIYVNCVAPGWVNTDMSTPTLSDAQGRAKVLNTIPIGRVATPEEIAAPILFLCTPHAGFITGEILNVNGGAVLVG